MNDPIQLKGDFDPVLVHETGVTIQAPGFFGEIEDISRKPREKGSRYDIHEDMRDLIYDQECDVAYEFELVVENDGIDDEVPTPKGGFNPMTDNNAQAIVLKVPIPSGSSQMPMAVLYHDEAGVPQWIFPQARKSAEEDSVSFYLPRKTAKSLEEDAQPKGLGKALKRVIKVISGIVDKIVGKPIELIAKLWEKAARPYGIHLLKGNHIQKGVDNWDLIAPTSGDPESCLLLIPGTFRTVSGDAGEGKGSFGPLLDSGSWPAIAHHYGNRVLGFDHPTLYHNPEQNIDEFLDRLPKDRSFKFQILTASRGGLVARELLHRIITNNTKGRNITIEKAVMVACCNQGTALADAQNIRQFLNRYTLMASLLPPNVFTVILKGILALVKVIASGVLELPGLEAQRPISSGNTFLQKLNAPGLKHQTELLAIGANYNAKLSDLSRYLLDQAVDRIFKDADNDIVVPTEGTHSSNGTHGFPLEHVAYEDTLDIFHMNYFRSELSQKKMQEWLIRPIKTAGTGPNPSPLV